MLRRMLNINADAMLPHLDATDALAAAYCHFLQAGRPERNADLPHTWSDFVRRRQPQGRTLTGPQQKLAQALCKKS